MFFFVFSLLEKTNGDVVIKQKEDSWVYMQVWPFSYNHILSVTHMGIISPALKEKKFPTCWNNFTQFTVNIKIAYNRALCQIRQHFREAGNKGSKWEGAGKGALSSLSE